MVMNQRHQYNELARTLLDTGQVTKAKETVDYALEVFPERLAPFDLSHVETTSLLLSLDDLSQADHIADTLAQQSKSTLEFAMRSGSMDSLDARRSLYTLRQLAMVYHRNGYTERSSQFATLFETYAKGLEG